MLSTMVKVNEVTVGQCVLPEGWFINLSSTCEQRKNSTRGANNQYVVISGSTCRTLWGTNDSQVISMSTSGADSRHGNVQGACDGIKRIGWEAGAELFGRPRPPVFIKTISSGKSTTF